MAVRQRCAVAMFALWTLYVWGQRVVNLRSGDEPGAAALVSAVLSATMVIGAVAVLVVLGRAWRKGWVQPSGRARWIVQALAVWTVAVWAVRGTGIVVDWRSSAFVAVHLVLAAVSIALACWSWRAVTPATERALPVVSRRG